MRRGSDLGRGVGHQQHGPGSTPQSQQHSHPYHGENSQGHQQNGPLSGATSQGQGLVTSRAMSHDHQRHGPFQQGHVPSSSNSTTNLNHVSMQQILDELRRGFEEQKKVKEEIRRMGQEMGKLREEYKKLNELLKSQTDSSFNIESSVYKVRVLVM